MVMVLPMLWFTLGINKSQPGSRIGSWIAICYLHLSSPLLAPILALHGSSLAPIYHDIYGMCQTNIQQEIVSWHKLLFAFPYHLFLNWKQEMVTWKQNTYFPKNEIFYWFDGALLMKTRNCPSYWFSGWNLLLDCQFLRDKSFILIQFIKLTGCGKYTHILTESSAFFTNAYTWNKNLSWTVNFGFRWMYVYQEIVSQEIKQIVFDEFIVLTNHVRFEI